MAGGPRRLARGHRHPLAEFVTLYLSVESKKQFNVELLATLIGDREQARTSVESPPDSRSPNLPIVKNVLRALGKAGMSHSAVRDSFARIGWTV